MQLIPLHGKYGEGLFTKVSDEDFDELSKFRWYAHLDSTTKNTSKKMYVLRTKDKKPIHQEIMGSIVGCEIDHINRDPLDNQRENLRLVTHWVNSMNSRIIKYKDLPIGVTKMRNKYQSQIKKDGRVIYLGLFNTAEEAHKRYLKEAA